jgi:phage-related protein
MEELSKEDTTGMMRFWYEQAVDEQKAELRQYKKKTKTQTQLPQIEPIPLTIEEIEEDLSQGQGEVSEGINA